MDGALANGPLAGAAWLIAAAALAAAAGLGLFVRAQAARLRDAETARAEAEKRSEELRGSLSSKQEGQKKQGDDRAELRRKLEKARKRAATAREEEQRAGARIAELEALLARRSADLKAVRMEAAAEAPPPPPAPVVDPSELESVRRERDRLTKQCEELRARTLRAEATAEEMRVETEKLRNKAKTQDRLYLAMRGELDAKKDRVRGLTEQLERLQALRVALGAPDDEAPDDPGARPEPPFASEDGAVLQPDDEASA